MKHWITRLFLLPLLASFPAWAGLDEADAAYKAGDYATALREWRPLADRGDAQAQTSLGFMYAEGRGVAQNDRLAVAWYRKAAEQGFADAQTQLGVMYKNGQGVPQDDTQAVAWYRKAAEQGQARAQNNLGFMYREGRGVPQDDTQAVAWYRKAAEQGYARAQNNLGFMYENGRGVAEDDRQAVAWYRKAAEQGQARAQTQLGVMYREGRGVPQDDRQAVAWYRKAVEQGQARAQNNLGFMYREGRGVAQDDTQAVAWFQKAAEQGYARAQNNLGIMYENGRGVPQDDKQAAAWFQKAAEQGYTYAQYSLGDMYESGRGVEKDAAKAVRWYRKAADQGYARAQNNLGFMYENGRGVPQDAAEAVRWFRKAADQEYAYAQSNLGWMYDNGEGVAKDAAEAVRWYRKAADQGYARAQYNLGVMYKNGEGVPKDAAEAVRWYRLAVHNPDLADKWKQRAQDALAALGQSAIATAAPIPAVLTPSPAHEPVNPPRYEAPPDTAAPALSFDPGNKIVLTEGLFILRGHAQDPSGIAEIRVNGQPITFGPDGAFSHKQFFRIGETPLVFVATDSHGNTAKATVAVLRKTTEAQAVAANEPELIPPEAKAKANPNALALIVGIEEYGHTFKAEHAARDAQLFYDYAQRTLGIPAENIKLLTGEKATRADLLNAVKNWLGPRVSPGKSQVVVFFAGHGLASSNGEKAFLIPHDGDPDMIEDTALDRQRLMADIAQAQPQSALFFFDTCYSGGARGGDKTLVAGARAITIKPRADLLPPNFMQFSAASNDQLAHSHPSQPHGLFSYYLMRGLSGEADANHDNRLTAGELQSFVQERVQRLAQTKGRPQVPELIGDPERVIAVWKR